MFLPESVLFCFQRLEQAGHSAYAVGGCVRDSLLGLTPEDYDLCTSATPEQLRQIFADLPLVTSGEKHGTVGVVLEDKMYEITTFRTEGTYTDSRHPDWVHFVTDVKEDLARRDFTVNAMAYSPKEGYIDPWGGQQDLANKILRAVGDPNRRFSEDALRILRGLRFAVRFGLTPEENTEKAMLQLTGLLDHLARERVFSELCKLILQIDVQQLLRYAPIITRVIPELAPSVGFAQHSPHHAYDVYTHTAHVVQATPPRLALRLAALLHDVGKVSSFSLDADGRGHFKGHAQLGAQMADQVLLRLKSPTALRRQVVELIRLHMTLLEADKKFLRRFMGKHGKDFLFDLLALQKADAASKGIAGDAPDFSPLEATLTQLEQESLCLRIKDLAINGSDLMALGFSSGPGLGRCLEHLLTLVQDESIPNTKEALLTEAGKQLTVNS